MWEAQVHTGLSNRTIQHIIINSVIKQVWVCVGVCVCVRVCKQDLDGDLCQGFSTMLKLTRDDG